MDIWIYGYMDRYMDKWIDVWINGYAEIYPNMPGCRPGRAPGRPSRPEARVPGPPILQGPWVQASGRPAGPAAGRPPADNFFG